MAITKEKNGTYTVQLRTRDWTGKIVHKKKRGFTKKKDAKQWESEKRNIGTEFTMTLRNFVEIYYEDKRLDVKERTLEHKQHIFNKHILPYFGDKRMNEISASDLIQWQNHIGSMNYKDSYMNDIHKQISALFSHASRVYHLQDNPCKRIKRMGSPDAQELNFWTLDEYNIFIKQLKEGTKYHVLFETLFWTGMRIGELLALSKSDIDIDNQQIRINKTYYRRNKKDYITKPKTQQSNRIIEVPEFLIDELAQYMKTIYGLGNEERIFPIVAEAVQRKLKREIEKGGHKKIRVHDYRHSHAAYLIDQGVDAILIRDRLGHKDIRITLNTYGHLYPTKQKQLAEMLNLSKKGSNNGNC